LFLRVLTSIPPAVLTLFVIAGILALVEALLWLPLHAKIALRLGMVLSLLLAEMWWIYSYEDRQVSVLILAVAFTILAVIASIFITRFMSSQAKQLREYRTHAEEARQRGDDETAALYDKTAKMIARPLGRIKL
jgi:hypothetical protein